MGISERNNSFIQFSKLFLDVSMDIYMARLENMLKGSMDLSYLRAIKNIWKEEDLQTILLIWINSL